MFDRFRKHLDESGLIPQYAKVVVGYSGGADSTCLLHVLKLLEIEVTAAHLHHGMRPEADDELDNCRKFCDGLEIPFVSGRADVPRLSIELKIGIEEAGRKARYAFFDQALSQLSANLIATAHTKTDVAETVVLNLVRGSGLAGVAGIPIRNGTVVRPLLPFSRRETREYCKCHQLWTHDDPTNDDVQFMRSRIRTLVAPQLESINPQYEDAIAQFAHIAGEENRFLDSAAAAALELCERPINGELAFLSSDCEIVFDRASLNHLPGPLLNRAIRLAASAIGVSLDFSQTTLASAGIRGDSVGSITADGGAVAIEWKEQIAHFRQLSPTTPIRYVLGFPGETESMEFGWRFGADIGEYSPGEQIRASLMAVINADTIRGELYFRPYKEGDVIEPIGFSGRRKVSDLLSEAKLTLAARQRLPIVCDMTGPIWIPGICLSNRVKLEEKATNAIRVRFEPILD